MIPVLAGPTGTKVEFKPFKNPEFTKNGKTYEIVSIRRRVGGDNGTWEEMDLSKLTAEEINHFMISAQKASKFIDKLGGPAGLNTAHSFTLHFQENQHTNKPFLIDKVTFIQNKGDNEQTHAIELNRFSEADVQKIQKKFHPLNVTIKRVFHRTMEQKPPLTLPKKTPQSVPLVEEID